MNVSAGWLKIFRACLMGTMTYSCVGMHVEQRLEPRFPSAISRLKPLLRKTHTHVLCKHNMPVTTSLTLRAIVFFLAEKRQVPASFVPAQTR